MTHKKHEGMIDQKKVHDNHQQGIERVKQRPGDLHKGQGGKMTWRGEDNADFKRKGGMMTPRKA